MNNMTPCVGCGKKMSVIDGSFKMRFIGKPQGKLMKGAPGSYEHGKTYMMSYRHSEFPYWELLEKPPKLTVPDQTVEDSVFEDSVFVPDEDEPDVPFTDDIPPELATIIGGDIGFLLSENGEGIDPSVKPQPTNQPSLETFTIGELRTFIDENGGDRKGITKKEDLLEAAKKLL